MSDIVKRLRCGEDCALDGGLTCIDMSAENDCICAIAADTITRRTEEVERMRAALQHIAWEQEEGDKPHMIARAALTKEESDE